MCRNDRRCRASWDQAQRDKENARRRITRNSAKRDRATSEGNDAKASEYEALIGKAQADLVTAESAKSTANAEHAAAPEDAQAAEAATTQPESGETLTVPFDAVATPTEPIEADRALDEPTDDFPYDEGADDSAAAKAEASPEGTESTSGPKRKEPRPKEPKEPKERGGTYRYIDPLDESPLGRIIKFYSGGYSTNRERVTATLDQYGIAHRVDEDGVSVSADAWDERTHDALRDAGFKDLPPRDADRGFLDWMFSQSEDAA